MKKLDKYILSRYLTSFFFCILLFTAIVVVIDISEKTEDFVKSKLPVSRIIVDYYFGFIPRIDAMLFPLFVFISVIFFTSKMAGKSEIIPILSSGISYRRFLMPYLAGGLFLTILLWVSYQYVVPPANRKWAEFQKRYVDVNKAPDENRRTYKEKIYFRLDPNTMLGIRGYDTVTKNGSNLFVQRFKNNKLVYNLRALSFRWDTAVKKWTLNDVTERTIDSISETVTMSKKKQVNYNFKPIDLRRDDYLKDQMITPELNRFIELEKMRNSEMLSSLLVERYSRDAIPLSVLILTIIGAVLASRKVRGGSGLHLLAGVVLSVLYILFSRLSLVFATKGDFSPWLAAWIPNFIFILLAIYLYRRTPK